MVLDEEKGKMEDLTVECMSEESSDSEGEHMIVHKPVWRSRGKHYCYCSCYHVVYYCSTSFVSIL